jgi:hypothetical protein
VSHLPAVVIVPESEWRAVLADIALLKASVQTPATPAAAPDELLTSREAARYLGLKDGRSVTKAKRAGRLSGVLINEKEWGFRRSELDRYLRRYNRQQPADAASGQLAIR